MSKGIFGRVDAPTDGEGAHPVCHPQVPKGGARMKVDLTALAHRRKLEADELKRLAAYEAHLRKRAEGHRKAALTAEQNAAAARRILEQSSK